FYPKHCLTSKSSLLSFLLRSCLFSIETFTRTTKFSFMYYVILALIYSKLSHTKSNTSTI
ncbi:unnamed protein product, partial [Prunus brigantina]